MAIDVFFRLKPFLFYLLEPRAKAPWQLMFFKAETILFYLLLSQAKAAVAIDVDCNDYLIKYYP